MDIAAIEREMDEVIGDTNEFQAVLREISELEGDSMESKLAILNQCNCCDRHQMNKPRTFAPWQEIESNMMMSHEPYIQCECDCRHMARWICRACTDDENNSDQNTWVDGETNGISESVM